MSVRIRQLLRMARTDVRVKNDLDALRFFLKYGG